VSALDSNKHYTQVVTGHNLQVVQISYPNIYEPVFHAAVSAGSAHNTTLSCDFRSNLPCFEGTANAGPSHVPALGRQHDRAQPLPYPQDMR